jgi:hypothetical protein
MTIDVAGPPLDSETECIFSELPSIIQDKIKLHLREQEEPTLCIVLTKKFKFGDEFTWDFLVQVLTSHRAIKIEGHTTVDKELLFSGYASVSMVLSNFVGFTEEERSVSTERPKYRLALHTSADNMKFYFWSHEKLKKFAKTILELSKDY